MNLFNKFQVEILMILEVLLKNFFNSLGLGKNKLSFNKFASNLASELCDGKYL